MSSRVVLVAGTLMSVLTLQAALAHAQASVEAPVNLRALSRTAEIATPQQESPRLAAPAMQPRKDPLWNGVAIGAGLGALVGAFAGSAMLETDTAGFNVPLTFGVIGAGAGAAIGAAIDAWRHPRSGTPSPSTRSRRVVVAPVIGRKAGGVVASIDLSK